MHNLETYLTSLGLKRNNGVRKSHHIRDEILYPDTVTNAELLIDYAEMGTGPNVYDYFLRKQAELDVAIYPISFSYLSNIKINDFKRLKEVLRFSDCESLGIVIHISYHIMKILTASVYEINDRTPKKERLRLLSEIQRRCLKEYQKQSEREAKSFRSLKDGLKIKPYGNFSFESEEKYIEHFDELVTSVISYSKHVHLHLTRGYSDSGFKERMTELKDRINVLMRPKPKEVGYVDSAREVPLFYDLIGRPLKGKFQNMRTWEDRAFASSLSSPVKTELPLLHLDHYYYRKSNFILCAMDIDAPVSPRDYAKICETFSDHICYKSFSGSPKVIFKIDVTNANIKENSHYRQIAIDVIREMSSKLDGKLDDFERIIDVVDLSYAGLFRAFITPDFMREVGRIAEIGSIIPDPIPDVIEIDYSLNPLTQLTVSQATLDEIGFPKATASFKGFLEILVASLSLAKEKGFCISQKKIAFQLGTDQGTISRYIRNLKNCGLLEVIDNDYVVGKIPKRYKALGALLNVIERSIQVSEKKKDIKVSLDERLSEVEKGTWHSLIWELSGVFKTESEFLRQFFSQASWQVKEAFLSRKDRQKKVRWAYKSRMRYELGIGRALSSG